MNEKKTMSWMPKHKVKQLIQFTLDKTTGS